MNKCTFLKFKELKWLFSIPPIPHSISENGKRTENERSTHMWISGLMCMRLTSVNEIGSTNTQTVWSSNENKTKIVCRHIIVSILFTPSAVLLHKLKTVKQLSSIQNYSKAESIFRWHFHASLLKIVVCLMLIVAFRKYGHEKFNK